MKTSELVRVERQRMLDERKHDQADETSEFFKDAFKIKENAKFEDFFIHPKLMKVYVIMLGYLTYSLKPKMICWCGSPNLWTKTSCYKGGML